MGITYGVTVPFIFGFAVYLSATTVGLSSTVSSIVAGSVMLVVAAAWLYSPLRLSYGFMARSDRWAGYWGFSDGDAE